MPETTQPAKLWQYKYVTAKVFPVDDKTGAFQSEPAEVAYQEILLQRAALTRNEFRDVLMAYESTRDWLDVERRRVEAKAAEAAAAEEQKNVTKARQNSYAPRANGLLCTNCGQGLETQDQCGGCVGAASDSNKPSETQDEQDAQTVQDMIDRADEDATDAANDIDSIG